MSPAPGTRLGPYEITAKLGEGGMGEVYRATDTKLRREVAIKVLPAAFTEDRERLARFEREAQALAQLHHPNIASIFGLEENGGVRALVMELVLGPTLAERLEGGPLPLDDSLSIARQIAEALEEAHEKGIVHRDLKPANVKLTADGKVKVLDFGLAKALDPVGGASSSSSQIAKSPTLTTAGTQMGMILGTAAYMAPEQAAGTAVDRRAEAADDARRRAPREEPPLPGLSPRRHDDSLPGADRGGRRPQRRERDRSARAAEREADPADRCQLLAAVLSRRADPLLARRHSARRAVQPEQHEARGRSGADRRPGRLHPERARSRD